MGKTTIEWTRAPDGTPGASWNPIRARDVFTGVTGWGCEILSPGCEHCYAEAINKRLGTGGDYKRRDRQKNEYYIDDRLLAQPLRWKRPRRIFVCSMTDLFGDWVTDEWLDRIFAVMALCPQHTFQVLTKRPERMRDYLIELQRSGRWLMWTHPIYGREIFDPIVAKLDVMLRNVWLGVSVEDQRRAWERTKFLWQTPATVRWVSLEPQLEHVDLPMSWGGARLDWVVIGGESGPGARLFDLQWARSLIAQCKAAGVAVFVKQLGSHPVGEWEGRPFASRYDRLRDRKGGDPLEWPEDLRVREYPELQVYGN